MNASAAGAGPMNAQTADEVAKSIADVIRNPVAELFTNPASAEIARRYYADVAAFEANAPRQQISADRSSETIGVQEITRAD
jgi:hypothetical protein